MEAKVKISRRNFTIGLGTAAASLAMPRLASAAPQYTFKFGFNLAESHPITARAKEAAAKILKESGGRLEVRVFPNNQLGGDTDMLAQLRTGGLELFLNSGINVLSTLIPSASVYGLGFLFPDYPAVWRAMDGDLGKYVRNQITKAGIVPFDKMWDNGFRNVTTSTKPIKTPEDLKNLKIRVPVGALWTSMFKAFGAAPASINFNEVYSALQTKLVDGQENSLANIYTAKLFEVQKYCSMTGHMWDGFFCVANRRAFEGLPQDLKTILTNNLNAAALGEREDMLKLTSTFQEQIAAKGVIFNKVDTAPFQDALKKAGFYKEWRAKYGEELWALVEATAGKLT
ncbi:TRAP transporter substrate-binding protein (plasmid) [Cupriavidus pinatubonensis]|uniref:TRAP transporter substrate-binding protein n=1 Tax=Cupriavidus pinatubonensis TaxID=248026 RepID=UPI001C72C494|nr:TRAP transporter substrate-binding protein [Cupriavidus pinatubonensis]